jgi:alpha-beta hydrolase superfamily lysophospholipase
MTLTDHPQAATAWDEPDGLTPRGTLLVIPGRGEEPALYQRLGRRLSADAYRVRVLPDPSASLASEAAARAEITRLLGDSGTVAPRVLVGSDTGALYAAALAAAGAAAPDALILAGLPAVALARAAEPSWDGELEARTSCPTHRDILARSQLRRGALFSAIPAGWPERAAPGQVRAPVLGIHGEADTVSPLAGICAWYRDAPAAYLVSVTDGRHDVLNDLSHRSVAATVVLFLERLRLRSGLPVIVRAEHSV